MNVAAASRIELLNKVNYDTWAVQMQAILITNDMWEYAGGNSMKPEPGDENENAAAIHAWEKNDQKARSLIILSMSSSEIKQVKTCNTARDTWNRLKDIYQSKGPARKATLLKKLTLHKMADNGDVRDHLNNFFDTVDKLGNMDIAINEELLTIMLLYSLPSRFENFRCAIETRDTLPTPEALRTKIIEENDARTSKEKGETADAMFVSKGGGKNKKKNKPDSKTNKYDSRDGTSEFRCFNCNKVGHRKSQCRSLKKNDAQNQNNSQSAQYVREVCLQAVVTSDIEAHEYSFQKSQVLEENETQEEDSEPFTQCTREECLQTVVAANHKSFDAPLGKWCVDSGATSHLSGNRSVFIEVDKSRTGLLSLANSSSTKIAGKGTVQFSTLVSGDEKKITLSNVSYVPDLRTSLLSVAKITDHGFDVLFKRKGGAVLDENGEIVMHAERMGDLYYILEHEASAHLASSSQSPSLVELDVLHRRLGHANIPDIVNAVKKQTIIGVQLKKPVNKLDCDICLKGKMSRSPFPQKSKRETTLLDLIHTDVCGPMPTRSLSGSRYYVEFIDDHSHWCEVKFLKTKAEVFEVTVEFITRMENQKKKRVKTIQSDNGREYLSGEFDDFLKKHGITRRLTVPYNPEQNGKAERMNRTLLESARCLLFQAKLPHRFWAEAVNTANYIRNRLPCKSLSGKTPHELWTGSAPDVSEMKTFGSRVYFLDRDPGRSKLDQRGREGIFLGYDDASKGYRVYSLDKKKVLISRDVKFFENEDLSEDVRKHLLDEDVAPGETFIDLHWSSNDDDRSTTDLQGPDIVDTNQPEARGTDDQDEFLDEPFRGFDVVPNVETPGPSGPPTRTNRGAGRPKILRTGQRGRPRKLFQEDVPTIFEEVEEDEQQTFLSEIPFDEAVKGPNANEWHEAIMAEIKSLLKNDTWILVDPPEGAKVIGCRMVLRDKLNPDGTLERRKARLVAQGFSQMYGVHYSNTFAPVARMGSIRLMMSLAAKYGMDVRQFDITTAYLNGDVEETIYMRTPKDLEKVLQSIASSQGDDTLKKKAKDMLGELRKGKKTCLLKKSLYGLKQAGRNWYEKLSKTLEDFGAKPTASDPCLFQMGSGEDVTMIAVYVDDILVVSRNEELVSKLGKFLGEHFEIRDIGPAQYFLGIEVVQNEGLIAMYQRGYIQELLQRFGMSNCNPVVTPLDPGNKLSKKENPSCEEYDLPYRELVGALTWLSTTTRPDISFATSYLGQFNNCYGHEHWKAAKRVLRYLKGTADIGIIYGADSEPLVGFVDADWGGCHMDRRSFTGFLFLLGGCPISWESRKQKTVALSTTEAEYMAMSDCAREAEYLQKFLHELGFDSLRNLVVFCDNQSAINLANNSMYHSRVKHIDLRHHFVREMLRSKTFNLKHVSTEKQIADFLTKSLSRIKHESCTKNAGLERIQCM